MMDPNAAALEDILRALRVSPALLAAAFCQMTEDDQARTIQAIGALTAQWGAMARDTQAIRIGEWLRDHDDATHYGKQFVRDIAAAMKES